MKKTGIFLFVLGFFSSIYSGFKFTGFAVSQFGFQDIFFIGMILMFGGILLTILGSQGALEVKLYRGKSKGGKEEVYMTDPENFFGKPEGITLEEFKEEIKELKKEPGFVEMIREAYLPSLIKYAREGGIFAEEAKKRLENMDFTFDEEKHEERYALPEDEIKEIKSAFKDLKEGPTPAQRTILKRYGLEHKKISRHWIIYPIGEEHRRVTVSLTPGDSRSGKNTASFLIKLCDEQYRKRERTKR